MKKYSLIIVFLTLISLPLLSQEAIIFNLQNGGKQSVKLDNIQRITFSGSNLLLKPVTGSQLSFLLADISKITFGGMITGISDTYIESADIKVYPNPVRDELKIDGDVPFDNLPFTIYNLAGQQIVNGQWQNGKSINVANLPKGIYFVKITTEKGIVTRKIIKE